jgi:outer membrane protein
MRRVLVFAIVVLAGLAQLQAQRYGHLNLGNIISIMPEAKAANGQLEVYQDSIVTAGEALAKAFETDYIAFAQAVQGGTMPPKQQAEQEAALRKRQEALVALEQQLPAMMEVERNKLLGPIVDKAMAAIEAVAKENGFVMIFDTSIFGAIMFADESEDVFALVKAKLGIE